MLFWWEVKIIKNRLTKAIKNIKKRIISGRKQSFSNEELALIIANQIKKELKEVQDSDQKKLELENICVFHWLDCLYQDFLNKRVAGGQIPCSSCKRVSECESCPPINFNLAGEKIGLKVSFIKAKSQQ